MSNPFRTPAPPRVRYDAPTIVLHWITAALVGLLWVIGQTIDFFPNGILRIDYRSTHIMLGVLLIGVLLARLCWRIYGGRSLPPDRHWLLAVAAKAIHRGLYLLLFATLALGLMNVWVRGDTIFGLFQVPAFSPGNRALVRLIGGWHALAANTVLIVAGLHAAAALLHQYVLGDDVLSRMVPFLQTSASPRHMPPGD